MNIIYLKSTESWQETVSSKKKYKWNLLIKKVEYKLRRIFNIPYAFKTFFNNTEYVLPYKAIETKKIIKFLKTRKYVQGIVLDKKLVRNSEICNKIKESNIFLINGKWLFRYLITEAIEYICEKRKTKIDTISVALLVNDTSDEIIQTIFQIAEKVKNISIITTEINKFRKIENKLYEEKGIPIKISSNKKKSLKKENIIINIDFTEVELKNYDICQNAIVINIKKDVNNIKKTFYGININNFEIEKTEYDINGFSSSSIYESIIYKKDTFSNIKLQLKKDRIKIKYLIGKRGKIQEDEYKNFIKTIDKNDNLT